MAERVEGLQFAPTSIVSSRLCIDCHCISRGGVSHKPLQQDDAVPGAEHSCSDEVSRAVLTFDVCSEPELEAASRFAGPSYGAANCTDPGYIFANKRYRRRSFKWHT
jgi:hypothetical protein